MREVTKEAVTMTLPRAVLPGRFYLVTRRCAQRQYLLKPCDEVNNAFIYCLAVAAEHAEIDIVVTCAMSNHHHTVIYDREGRYPEFLEHFHKLLARCLNALYERRENFWSSHQVSVVRLGNRGDILDKIVYAITNPVAAHAVEHAVEWPGVNGYAALLSGEPLRATRPTFFFRQHNSKLPKEVALHMAFPEEMHDPHGARARVRELVEEREDELADTRRRSGIRVLGAKGVLAMKRTRKGTADEELYGLSPTLAAKDSDLRIEMIRERDEFLASYRAARDALLVRRRNRRARVSPFPKGTWWLARHASVRVV